MNDFAWLYIGVQPQKNLLFHDTKTVHLNDSSYTFNNNKINWTDTLCLHKISCTTMRIITVYIRVQAQWLAKNSANEANTWINK